MEGTSLYDRYQDMMLGSGELTEEMLDHCMNPRNMGEIEQADGVGLAGSSRCGDVMRIYLAIDEKQIIQDAKFKVFGCGASIPGSSLVTELIIGKTVNEAKAFVDQELQDETSRSGEEFDCLFVPHAAIDAALNDYHAKQRASRLEKALDRDGAEHNFTAP